MQYIDFIRNFCIIAHIDHGKSTLADRFLQITEAIDPREFKNQMLDSMDIERERGITIKAQTVSLHYVHTDGKEYELNLIDTPGHVDFTYEVSRSLAACEGAILVIDATQGVEAQTVANVNLAMQQNLTIIPVINKIDLPSADPELIKKEIEEELAIDSSEAILCSAKLGIGIEQILNKIITKIPHPPYNTGDTLKALIFDSWFDSYLGAISLVRIVSGKIYKNQKIRMMSNNKVFEITKVAKLTPAIIDVNELKTGEVGIIAAGIKSIADTRVGDTITDNSNPSLTPLTGFKPAKQVVFASIYPVDSSDFNLLKESLDKLSLNDASLTFEPESSSALGLGFRAGFLGLLHMDIIQERLEREYKLNLVFTAPSVIYKVYLTNGTILNIENPAKLPPTTQIKEIHEPYVCLTVHTPEEYIGAILKILNQKRGTQNTIEYISNKKVKIIYDIPMNEIIFDFHDKLKSISKGYASMDYEFKEYKPGDLIKLDILVNSEPVDALSCIIHRENSYQRGVNLCRKLKDIIPRQMFQVAIQAAIGNKIIARTTVPAFRKDVLAKCYGGDVTRKRKLLEKQKEGKKRMKQFGNVEIPQEAFRAILSIDE